MTKTKQNNIIQINKENFLKVKQNCVSKIKKNNMVQTKKKNFT